MIEPVKPAGGWNIFSDPRPYTTTSGLAVDSKGNFPILYRGPKVRSARNKWSLPSGLHEIGFRLGEQFAVELKEECNLTADPRSAVEICSYENIAPDLVENTDSKQWHWVIHILAIHVETLDTFVNSEPDKHPEYRVVNINDLPKLITELQWSGGLAEAMSDNLEALQLAVSRAQLWPFGRHSFVEVESRYVCRHCGKRAVIPNDLCISPKPVGVSDSTGCQKDPIVAARLQRFASQKPANRQE